MHPVGPVGKRKRKSISNYSGVYEVSRVSALRSESEAAQTVPIRDFQSLKPAFLRDPLNAYVYKRIGEHPAFSQCYHAAPNFLVLKRLYGTTLYDCLSKGLRIRSQVIRDIDAALVYARDQGMTPHDVHGRNVMMTKEGRGLVVDISDFLHDEPDTAWDDLKVAYRWIYRPIFYWSGLRVPMGFLDWVRAFYRKLRRWRDRA
ncbi:MAG: hypothetical protein ACO35Q_05520 [Prochlorothrix sp.]